MPGQMLSCRFCFRVKCLVLAIICLSLVSDAFQSHSTRFCQSHIKSKSRCINKDIFFTNSIKRTNTISTFSLFNSVSPNDKATRNNKSTLTENSLWKLTIFLQKEGYQSVEAVVRLRFLQSKNYEPPSGKIFIEDDYNGLIRVDEQGYVGVWTLSEDKDDRKDGLWVRGLFEEPKYPFLYFYLDIYPSIIVDRKEYEKTYKTNSINDSSSNSNSNDIVSIEIKDPNSSLSPDQIEIPIFDGKSIPKNRLNFRFDFTQVSLKEGIQLQNGNMNYQLSEQMNADPFGIGGQVEVGDYVNAGRVNILYVSE